MNLVAQRTHRAGGRRAAVMGAAMVSTVALAACQGASGQGARVVPPAQLAISVASGATDVTPDQPVTVAVTDGTLRTVSLTDAKGTTSAGQQEEASWRLTQPLRLATTYTLAVTTAGADGQEQTHQRSFSTLTPAVEATYRVTPDGSTVGVGMPVMVTFDSAVSTADLRAEVEKRMKIKTVPRTTGSWGWVDPTRLMWRPQTYWKPGTKVSVNAPLAGAQTGEDKWIVADKAATFTIADRARISTVDLDDHTITVRDDGKTITTYPMSAGQPTSSWQTRSGTKVITEKTSFLVMDAATLGVPEGDPNYYRTEVKYAMRVTDTGEYFHSAPWSVWAQGRRNVSHGCVNLGPRDAKQFFESSLVGDVAEFVGGNRPMKPDEGMPAWLFTWAQWQAKSALAPTPDDKPKKTATTTGAPRTASRGVEDPAAAEQ